MIRFVGPDGTVEVLGIKLVGINAANGVKLLVTIGLILLLYLLGWALRALVAWIVGGGRDTRTNFWTRQGIRLTTAALMFIGLISIWFDDPVRLATALGLVTAGLAFALQKVVTAFAAYFVILRGKTFNVGDRIRMGGVRGDVIALDFLQTTIMEMGQPAPVQGDEPAMWVQSRQYTGRIVTVSNAKIFDDPVYNYSSEFPYLWEEVRLPIPYAADRARAERIMLAAAEKHTLPIRDLSADALGELQRRYFVGTPDLVPRVYYRMTDNWLEMTVRFIARDRGVRELKDALTRDMLRDLDEAGIGMAAATFELVGLPPLRIEGGLPTGKESPS